jgi:hypothetical protein
MKTRKKDHPLTGEWNHYSAVVHVVELRCKPEACVSILGGIIRDFN